MTDPIQTFEDILAGHGPLTEDDFVRRLVTAGVRDAEDVFDELLDEIGSAAGELIDGRWVWLPKLLAGRLFTHRLTADELAHDILQVTPDLDPITTLCDSEDFAHFVDGSPATVVLPMFDHDALGERGIPLELVDPLGSLLLAPGTLTSLGASVGDLVALRLAPGGLTLERVAEIDDAADVGARLAALVTDDPPRFFDSVVWTACSEDPTLFGGPAAPLSEIADTAGLTYEEEWLGPAGFDFGMWHFKRACDRLAHRYELTVDDAFALNTLLVVCARMAEFLETANPDENWDVSPHLDDSVDDGLPSFDELAADLGGVLADPMLAEILMTETIDRGRGGPAALGLFAETLESKVARPARVAFRWLRAVALERTGQVEEAERNLLTAETMDIDWAPALFDLARFAGDRGDVERALSLMRRAGAAPDDPFVTLLERHRVTPRSDLGRNDVCWCGSGRKYKKCHLGREELPLAERADWLYSKAAQHVVLSGWRELLDEVAEERMAYLDDDVDDGLADPLLVDVVLFEGGAFADFVQTRGFLLPDDERALAEQWLLVERSVFEIEEVRRGKGITVRDVRTGDRHEVRERLASGQLKVGQLFCGRVVPAGDTTQIFGGLEPVALHERDALIALLDSDVDPVELVATLSRRFAPPTLVNTDGHLMAICQATVRVGEPDRIHAALDDAYDREDGQEPPRWLEHTTAQGMSRVRATLDLDGDTLHVDTNSEERMDAVLETLRRIDPGMTVLEDARQPIHDAREAARLAAQQPKHTGTTLDPADPAVAAALDDFIRTYETNWLNESIPALDGYTPRQCADDPTRRGDLVKLLDSFPSGEAALGGMNVDRLRAALGL